MLASPARGSVGAVGAARNRFDRRRGGAGVLPRRDSQCGADDLYRGARSALRPRGVARTIFEARGTISADAGTGFDPESQTPAAWIDRLRPARTSARIR